MPHARISTANLNLPPIKAMKEGYSFHDDFLNEAGYTGFEVHPVRGRMTAEILLGKKTTELVTSWHQSFVDMNLRQIASSTIKRDSNVTGDHLKLAIGLPDRKRSLGYLATMQARIDQLLPVVLYPEKQGTQRQYNFNYKAYENTFEKRLWQPTAKILDDWEVPLDSGADIALSGMTKAMEKRNFDALCIDTFHWSATQKELSMPPWQDMLPRLAADNNIREIHFCPARPDFGDDGNQLRKILNGDIANTRSGQMLETIARHTPDSELYVVTELTHQAITDLGYRDYVGVHRELVAAIRDTVDNVK